MPGGDPAAFVKEQLREPRAGRRPSRARARSASRARGAIRGAIPARYATVEPDGDDACVVTTPERWSREFLVWMATLDEPIEVLGPPELVEAARAIAARLAAAA